MKYNLLIEWLEKAKELQVGEELLFPVQNKEEQKRLKLALKRELKILSTLDPIEASTIEIRVIFRDHKHWVSLTKVAGTPLIAFKKGTDGEIERVKIQLQGKDIRLLKLMKADGLIIAKAERILERKLTEEEKEGWIERREE